MKMTSVISRDQRWKLQLNSHTFPTNTWIHKITKRKQSDRCDPCKSLWIVEDRFTTEKDLPEQNLGHIQHTCDTLSEGHINTHHQCLRLIHGELARLTAPTWKFLCFSGEKYLQTLWNEIPGPVVSEPYEVYDLEYCKRPWDGSSPQTSRSEKGPRRSRKGRNSERKILMDVTGRNSGPSTYRKQDQSLMHPRTQTYVRRVRPLPYKSQTNSWEPIRIPRKHHQWGDTTPRLEGGTN